MSKAAHTELKPCPFCGGKDLQTFSLGRKYYAQCVNCDVDQIGNTEADAVIAWNTRASAKGINLDAITDVLRDARACLANSGAESGYCMCGCPIEGHSYGNGHSPVDAHSYVSEQIVERIDALLTEQVAS